MSTHRWLVAKPADYSRLEQRSTKTPQRPCRSSPSISGWEHRRTRGGSDLSAAVFSPKRESEVGVTRGSDGSAAATDECRTPRRGPGPAEAGHTRKQVRLKPDTTYAQSAGG